MDASAIAAPFALPTATRAVPSVSPVPEPGFRPMTLDDLPMTYAWLDTPAVRQWYHKRSYTRALWDAEYAARIRGELPTRPFIMTLDAEPIGYIQSFRIADWPDYARRLPDAAPEAVAVDLFIGRPDCLGRGLGTRLLALFVRDHVFAQRHADECPIGPEPVNRHAIRCYSRAGFSFWKITWDPEYGEYEYWMRRLPAAAGQPLRPAA